MHKMADLLYLHFKSNRIKIQADNTATCGAFALRFIADMFEGKKFEDPTHFTDKHIDGEKGIRHYISKWEHIKPIYHVSASPVFISVPRTYIKILTRWLILILDQIH